MRGKSQGSEPRDDGGMEVWVEHHKGLGPPKLIIMKSLRWERASKIVEFNC